MDLPAAQASPANPKALPWREAIRLSLGISLAARLGLGAVMAAAWLVSLPHLNLGPNPGETLFAGLHWYATPAGQALLGVWARWDAIHHLNLARLGYFQVGIGESVYYPLYAGLVSAVTRAFVHDYVLGGLIVSTLATASALVFLFLLVDHTLGRESARNTVWALAVYPTAFFLWAPFTESLFVCLTLAAFLAAYLARGWWAAPAAFLASLARGPGALSAASLAWIGLKQWRAMAAGHRIGAVAGTVVAAGMAGAGGLAFQIWRQGAGFQPMSDILRDYSKLNWIGPLNGAWLAITQLVHKPEFLPLIEMASALLFLGLLIAMLVRPRWRRGDWIIFMALNLALFTGVHTFEASAWRSIARYVLILFPGFIVLGDWLAGQSGRVRLAYFTVSLTLQVVFSALYALFWFIG